MFEQLFTTEPHIDLKPPKGRRRKGTIVGAGQVGMACAYSMLIQNTLDELVIIDINREKLEGEIMDLLHGLPFVEPTLIRAGEPADTANSDVIIITAGAKQKPGETRLDLVQRNVTIFKDLIPSLVEHCPEGIYLLVSNPVDIMTYVTLKLSELPKSRVIGSGTVLDTARFRYLLASQIHIDPRSLHAYIIGEHGDSEVPVWSKVNIAGTHLCGGGWEGSPSCDNQALDTIFQQVKNAAYEIIQRKGATNYAIGLGVTQIVQAILRDQNRVLTVSSLIDGLHGVRDVCLSLPSVVNRYGVTRVLNLSLSDGEKQKLQQSGQTLQAVLEQIDWS